MQKIVLKVFFFLDFIKIKKNKPEILEAYIIWCTWSYTVAWYGKIAKVNKVINIKE